MKTKHGVLIALACVGACAVPLAIPLLTGAGLAVMGVALLKPSWELIACGGGALLIIALLVVGRRRVKASSSPLGESCHVDGSCGCRPGTSKGT
jgi:hypothetical protein